MNRGILKKTALVATLLGGIGTAGAQVKLAHPTLTVSNTNLVGLLDPCHSASQLKNHDTAVRCAAQLRQQFQGAVQSDLNPQPIALPDGTQTTGKLSPFDQTRVKRLA